MRDSGGAIRRWAFVLVASLAVGISVQASAATLSHHEVVVDEHPFAVWAKVPEMPKAVMLLVHGRTWSTRPDFDLQVPGEDLSLMDGLAARGIAAYGVDLRGYGATPRDASGWLTPDRAALDVGEVLRWVRKRHPGLPAPYLFGWSYGAMVSQLVSQREPDAMSGIVLFGYPVRPGYDQDPPDEKPLRAPTTAEAAASDFLLPGTISEAGINAFVASALAHDPIRVDWRERSRWRSLDAAEIDVPVLLLQAAEDPLALADVHARFFAALTAVDKAWVVIPGGDHAAFMETPRPYFLALVETFVFRGSQ